MKLPRTVRSWMAKLMNPGRVRALVERYGIEVEVALDQQAHGTADLGQVGEAPVAVLLLVAEHQAPEHDVDAVAGAGVAERDLGAVLELRTGLGRVPGPVRPGREVLDPGNVVAALDGRQRLLELPSQQRGGLHVEPPISVSSAFSLASSHSRVRIE